MFRLLLIIILLLPTVAFAETAEEKGLAIAKKVELRDSGWGDSESMLFMVLKNRHGEESKREMRNKILEVKGDGDKSLTIFDTPKDVKGTAFLTFTHKVGDDEQWLYLPALKRVKRISSRNKSGSFMGSEFAYEDIASQEVEKYTYKWMRDEAYEGKECFVSESYPVAKRYSGYTKLVSWVDKAEYRPWKIEFYDRKGLHFKTLKFGDYKKYLDKFWRANRMEMVNHQNGKSTQISFKDFRFRTGLKDSDLNKNSLKRAK